MDLMKRIEAVATRTKRCVARSRLLEICEHTEGEDRTTLRLAADVLDVLDIQADRIDYSAFTKDELLEYERLASKVKLKPRESWKRCPWCDVEMQPHTDPVREGETECPKCGASAMAFGGV